VVADVGSDTDGTSQSRGPADSVVGEIETSGGRAVPSYASVADEAGAASVVATAMDSFGRVDGIINNAGIFDPGPFESLSVDQFRRMMDVHFFGTLSVIKAAWPYLTEAGYGRIVNTVSESMLGGFGIHSSYAAAKGAVFGLTRALATEGSRYGIGVNAIAPRALTRIATRGSYAGRSEDEVDRARLALAPDLNAPVAAFLVHHACQLNGEVLRSGMSSVARIAAIQTVGVTSPDLTIEDVARNLPAILDPTDAVVG
jgi:NAD(P)-dependent dehydrogenase (short-subunit alcohol dehydrogenase family)